MRHQVKVIARRSGVATLLLFVGAAIGCSSSPAKTDGGGGAGGGPSSPCNGTCRLGTYCGGCGNGGTKKLACSCFIDNTDAGRWSCGSLGPCGSNGCGPAGARRGSGRARRAPDRAVSPVAITAACPARSASTSASTADSRSTVGPVSPRSRPPVPSCRTRAVARLRHAPRASFPLTAAPCRASVATSGHGRSIASLVAREHRQRRGNVLHRFQRRRRHEVRPSAESQPRAESRARSPIVGSTLLLLAVLALVHGCGGTTASPDGGGGGGGSAGGQSGGGGSTGGPGGSSAGAGGGAGGRGGASGSGGGGGSAGGAGMDGGAGGRGGAGGNRSCGSNGDCQGGQVCYVGVNSCGTAAGGQCVTRLSDGCSGCACLGIVSGSCPAGQGANCLESGVAGGCWYCAAPI